MLAKKWRTISLLAALVLAFSLVSCSSDPKRTDRKEPESMGIVIVPGLEDESSSAAPSEPSVNTPSGSEAPSGETPTPTPTPEPEETIPQNIEQLTLAVSAIKKSENSYFDRQGEKVVGSYFQDGCAILIRQLVFGKGDDRLTCYVADLYLDNVKDLVGCVFNDSEGNISDGSPERVEEQLGAVFVMNTDFIKGRSWGLYVRGGHVFRNKPTKGIDVCAINKDGKMEILDGDTLNADALLKSGKVWHVLTFGPSLLNKDGSPKNQNSDFRINNNYQGWDDDKSYYGFLSPNPRTAIGQAQDGHFILVTVDGRDEGYSKGMTFPQLSHLMYEEGCTVAYNLDGGGSTMMYFDGAFVNKPSGGRDPGDYFCIIRKEN